MKSVPFASPRFVLAILVAGHLACTSEHSTSDGTGGAAVSGGASGSGTGGVPGSGGATVAGGSGTGGQSAGGSSATGGNNTGGSATGGSPGLGGTTTGGSGGGSTAAGSGGRNDSGGSISSSGGVGGISGSGGAVGSGGSLGGATGGGGSSARHWVGTWSASPYPVAAADQPPAALANSVVRQIAHVSLGGSQIRVQFSNLSGDGPVTIKSAHVAPCKASPLVDGSIDTATDKALAFSGMASVTIEKGKEVWSDSIDFTVAALGNVSITTAFGSTPGGLTGHAGSRTTSYQQAGSSDVSAANMTSAQKADHWYYISGIDVMADASAVAAVAIGDSITDGRGVDTNKNNRWTDILSARLQANAATSKVALLNQGIGGTPLIGTSGTAAQARFNRDVLGQSGVRYALVFDGVNDIGGNQSFAAMKSAYDGLISAAHAKGLLIYGATILPFAENVGGTGYYTMDHETVRQQVNTYIKGGAFDGYIDFDAALTDGGAPPKLQSIYAEWAQRDGLHPGPAGYQKMGDIVDLTLFSK